MKKIFTLLSFTLLISSQKSFGQTILLSEDFSTYQGTAGTVPAGWIFSNYGSYSSNFINSGCDSTAYKFSVVSGDTSIITTPSFSSADSVSFWLKGTSGIDSANTLLVLETADGSNYDTIAQIVPVPTTGIIKKYPVNINSIQLRFKYLKFAAGNVAFDCFLLTGQEPISANFSAPNVCIGDSTCFSDMSSTQIGTITSWEWDFNDGSTSTLQNPCHLYLNAGSYSVQLIVTNSNSEKDTIVKTVSVGDYPSAFFFAANNCLNDTTFFSDSSTISSGTISTWNWDFGDSSFSALQNPSHLYSAAGVYTVSVDVVSDIGCSNSFTDYFTVYDLPLTPMLSDTSISYCENDSIEPLAVIAFEGNFTWYDDSALTSVVANGIYYLPILNLGENNFYVTETSVEGCESAAEIIIVTLNQNPVADFTMNLGMGVVDCSDNSISIYSRLWNFGPTPFDTLQTSSVQNPTFTFGDGIWYVCLTVNNLLGCVDDTCQSFNYVGVNETYSQSSFEISPNPSNGKFLIQTSNIQHPISNIKVSNILGETIFNSQFSILNSQFLIDLTTQPEGTYFVTITSAEKTATKKIVIIK